MHSYLAGYQRREYPSVLGSAIAGRRTDRRDRVGVELMTPAVTSVNIAEAVGVEDGWLAAATEPLLSGAVETLFPHVEFFNSHEWGYSIVDFTREACTYRAYSVDKSVDSAEAERSLLVTLRIPDGRVAIERMG
jgi:alkaline phosphatase D